MDLCGSRFEQQTPHTFRVGWEFVIPTVMVLQIRARGVPKAIFSVEDRGKEGIKHLCFAHVLVCEVTFLINSGPMFSLVLHFLLTN